MMKSGEKETNEARLDWDNCDDFFSPPNDMIEFFNGIRGDYKLSIYSTAAVEIMKSRFHGEHFFYELCKAAERVRLASAFEDARRLSNVLLKSVFDLPEYKYDARADTSFPRILIIETTAVDSPMFNHRIRPLPNPIINPPKGS